MGRAEAGGRAGTPLKGETEASLLLQVPVGLGPTEEETLETEKEEGEGETEYTATGTTPETTTASSADGSNSTSSKNASGSSTCCFTSMGVVEPGKQQEVCVSSRNQAGVLVGCRSFTLAESRMPLNSGLATVENPVPHQDLQHLPVSRSRRLGCQSRALIATVTASCRGGGLLSPPAPPLETPLPLDTSRGTSAATTGRRGTSSPRRLPLLPSGGEVTGPPTVSGGFLLPSVFLGPSMQGPFPISGAAAAAAPAFSSAVVHRLPNCSFGGPPGLPSTLSVGGGAGTLSPWAQQQKQQQQQDANQGQPAGSPLIAKTNPNVPVILTALRRHLRSLIRIMYNKPPMKLPAKGPMGQGATGLQRASSHVMCAPEGTGGCRSPATPSGVPSHSRCCMEGLPTTPAEKKQSGGIAVQETEGSATAQGRGGSVDPVATAGQLLSETPSAPAKVSPPLPQAGHTEGSNRSAEATALSASCTSGTLSLGSNAAAAETAPLSSVGTGDGAAESWEGQCFFHEEHLGMCSLSDLSEYLSIFSSFLSLSLSEISRQDPSTLQHVRLQLLLLRNNQQQRQQRIRQQRQRQLPLLDGAVAGTEGTGEGSGDPPTNCGAGGAPAIGPCWRPVATAPSVPSLLFGSGSSPLLASFSSSARACPVGDAPSGAAGGISGDQPATSRDVGAGAHDKIRPCCCCWAMLPVAEQVTGFV